MDFSIMFFENDINKNRNKYAFVKKASRMADQSGFKAVWIPERHFHPFGGIFPNPSIIGAWLAGETKRIRIRAGSVVLPLHHPVRVAEEWAVVDHLSNGRVDVSFTKGWNAREFIFSNYPIQDNESLFNAIHLIQQLWQGKTANFNTATGEPRELEIYPKTIQPTIPTWISTFNADLFEKAGESGYNILTALLLQDLDELKAKILRYRLGREKAGLDPNKGTISLMLHTYIDDTIEQVRQTVRKPFLNYLASSVTLWRQREEKLNMSATDQEKLLNYAYERYFRNATLFVTETELAEKVEKIAAIGVSEIACLIDFGISSTQALNSLKKLAKHII